MLKRISLGLLIILVALQFFRPARNFSAGPSPNDIAAQPSTPPEVRHLLETACYDCHSNHTRYPWYAQVQPIGWGLAYHIRSGKRHLNFSEFAAYPAKRAAARLDTAIDEVTDHGMPLFSYRLMHADARLTDEQIKRFTDWAEATRQRLLAPPTTPSAP